MGGLWWSCALLPAAVAKPSNLSSGSFSSGHLCAFDFAIFSISPYVQFRHLFNFALGPFLFFSSDFFVHFDFWIFMMFHCLVSIFSSFTDFLAPPYLRLPPCSPSPGYSRIFTLSTVFAPGHASAFLQILRQLSAFFRF